MKINSLLLRICLVIPIICYSDKTLAQNRLSGSIGNKKTIRLVKVERAAIQFLIHWTPTNLSSVL
jgi:hypothetical protein